MSEPLLIKLIETLPNIAIAVVALYLLYKKLDEIDRYLRSILDRVLEKALTDETPPCEDTQEIA